MNETINYCEKRLNETESGFFKMTLCFLENFFIVFSVMIINIYFWPDEIVPM